MTRLLHPLLPVLAFLFVQSLPAPAGAGGPRDPSCCDACRPGCCPPTVRVICCPDETAPAEPAKTSCCDR